jgi:hypothetical protein
MLWYEQTGVVLVEDPYFPYRSADYSQLLLVGRKKVVSPTKPYLATLTPPRPPWVLFEDSLVSVYPVLEAYSQQALTLVNPWSAFYKGVQLPEPEEDFKRFDHGVYFSLVRRYAAQLIGYTFDQPDFCDDPWIEWVHPAPTPESQLFPFRSPGISIRGQQFNLFFNQPQPWRIEEEGDFVHRQPDLGALLLYPHTLVTFIVPNVVGLPQAAAVISITSAFFTVGTITTAHSNVVAGLVISQNPIGGTQAGFGSAVSFVVSIGPIPSGTIVMPDLSGILYFQAEANLVTAGIVIPSKIGYFDEWPIAVKWITDPQVLAGYVVSQTPAAGTPVKPNSPIVLTVSDYTVEVAYP